MADLRVRYAEAGSVAAYRQDRDGFRPQRGDLRAQLDRASSEVARAQVVRALRRAVHEVRDADAERQELAGLARVQHPRRQARLMERAPEEVLRVAEVVARCA